MHVYVHVRAQLLRMQMHMADAAMANRRARQVRMLELQHAQLRELE